MDFYSLKEYTISDIEQLIQDEVEENIHLDYKRCGSLSKEDKKRTEIAKDVSAFANSDGGIIVYGLAEVENKPESLSFIDGNIYTKEWLENVINLIQPRIHGIEIFPIRKDEDLEKTIYVVKIPRSASAPHMSLDKRFYRRYNFMSVPMEEYEVKDLYFRKAIPELSIDSCCFCKLEKQDNEGFVNYELQASIVNIGNVPCESYKLNFIVNNTFLCDYSYQPLVTQHSFTLMDNCCLKISCPSREILYPEEKLALGHIIIQVKEEYESAFMEKLVIKMALLWSGGKEVLANIPASKKFEYDNEKIDELLEINAIDIKKCFVDLEED